MSRIARNKYKASFFHVIIQGINKEYIFEEERYIKQYLKLLKKYEKQFDLCIIAYCIMNNHAHILLSINKIEDMSKFMQKVNSMYANYYNYINKNRVGYVYRGRFISEPILDKRYFIKYINYIHQNPVKALMVEKAEDYIYSSYNEYLNDKNILKSKRIDILKSVLETENYKEILTSNNKNINLFCDVDEEINEIIENKIMDYLEINQKKLEEIFMSEKLLRNLIIFLMENGRKIKKKDIMKKLSISKNKLLDLLKSSY